MKETKKNPPTSSNKQPFSFAKLNRSAGILLHITSLPSSFGIGDFGSGARAFANFLHRSGQTFWQLLPLNPTTAGQGYSPYSASSAMAGNPLLISPELLVEEKLLTETDIAPYRMAETNKVDYKKAEKNKCALLEKAYQNYCNGSSALQKAFVSFCEKEDYWLNDFALYSVLQKENKGKPWHEWEEPFKQHDANTLRRFEEAHSEEINKIKWQQLIFAKQWHALKNYCNNLNIKLFGDMPIYVGYDSSDVWSNREIFSIDANGKQEFVAGTPPDEFNKDGQLWGMPVFKWEVIQKQNYNWWIKRLRKNLELFDLLRLDHFRAFEAYYQVKAGSQTALEGKWIKALGNEFFSIVKKELENKDLPFVAEDLGHIDEPVYKLRDDFKLPGMEVLQFAFGEDMPTNVHIPHNQVPVAVVYTGTHDTNTILGWYKDLPKQRKKNLASYTGIKITQQNVADVLCRIVYASVSKLAILPLQDIIGLNEKARMNIPSYGENNWAWRATSKLMNKEVEKKLTEWVRIYNRTYKESDQ